MSLPGPYLKTIGRTRAAARLLLLPSARPKGWSATPRRFDICMQLSILTNYLNYITNLEVWQVLERRAAYRRREALCETGPGLSRDPSASPAMPGPVVGPIAFQRSRLEYPKGAPRAAACRSPAEERAAEPRESSVALQTARGDAALAMAAGSVRKSGVFPVMKISTPISRGPILRFARGNRGLF